ncbi:hypothetical protein CPC08DRAFT_715415 [Agrocybe pediades]|nr:hypothetical protein CPC08DRAFT_715415 [Agrocybe pediades]
MALRKGLRPPTLDAVKSAYSSLCGEFGRVGVYGLQAYGTFKIGEIIGRWHVVGYKLD